MKVGEKAVELHSEGYNCAQSVLCAVAEELGVDAGNLKSVSAGFGGGLRCGEVCGAVSGAVMALGLATAGDGNGSVTAPVADCARKISAEFNKKYGCMRCVELLKSNDGKKRCPEFIDYCSGLATEIAEGLKAE